jgi:ABC-type uncharacterized transport system permease subunit
VHKNDNSHGIWQGDFQILAKFNAKVIYFYFEVTLQV